MKPKYTPRRDPKNTTKSISLPKNIVDAIQKKAEREGRSFSNMVAQILKNQIDHNSDMVFAETQAKYGVPKPIAEKKDCA